VQSLDGTLSAERVITGGSSIGLVDGGANGNMTINFDGGLTPSGDLGGTWVTPTVTDLTITGESQGDLLYFNGANWIKVDLGTSRSVLAVNDGATAPVWVAARSGAPTAATYIVQSNDGTLTNERVITGGSAIGLADGGAGSTMTINFDGGTAPSGDLGGTWVTPSVINVTASTAPASDQTGNGIKVSAIVGETVAIGNVVYMKSNSKYGKSDADAAASMPAVALATVAITADNAGILMKQGYFRDDTWDWTIGGLLYASSIAGTITQTVPSNSGQQVQVLGYAVTADVIYFNPSLVLVELA